MERVAVTPFRSVEMREQFQRLDLGIVTAPDRRERLEIVDGGGPRELAERVLQLDLTQLSLRGGATIRGISGELIGLERVLEAAEPFRHLAVVDRQARLQLGR